MMDYCTLPTQLPIGGELYDIRTDFRAILDILKAYNDKELDDSDKIEVLIDILYVNSETIPEDKLQEALDIAQQFIDAGIPDDGKQRPRTMDWEKDAPIIIPEVNKVLKKEVRAEKYMHWWTFTGAYMQIDGEGLFSQILNVRQKKAKCKKLEKYEEEFYRNNKPLCDLNWNQKQNDEDKKMLKKIFG